MPGSDQALIFQKGLIATRVFQSLGKYLHSEKQDIFHRGVEGRLRTVSRDPDTQRPLVATPLAGIGGRAGQSTIWRSSVAIKPAGRGVGQPARWWCPASASQEPAPRRHAEELTVMRRSMVMNLRTGSDERRPHHARLVIIIITEAAGVLKSCL